MKNLLLFAVVIVCFNDKNLAQTPPKISSALDKFVGIWIYKEGDKEVKLYLKKEIIDVPASHAKITVIQGYDVCSINNKIIENTMSRGIPPLTTGSFEDRENLDKIKITYRDSAKNKSCDAILIFLPGDRPKIQWYLRDKAGLRVHKPGESNFDKTFTLPERMILSKEN